MPRPDPNDPVQEWTPTPDAFDAFAAGFQLEHSVASALAGPRPGDFQPEDGYLPDFSAIAEEGFDPLDFVNSVSSDHEAYLKSAIVSERKRRQIANNSAVGMVGMMAGAFTDPFMALATVATAGTSTVAGVGVRTLNVGWKGIATAEMIGAAATEAVLQKTQAERTALETAINVAASGIVTGVLGAAAEGVSAGFVDAARRRYAEDIKRTLSNDKIPDEVRGALSADLARLTSIEDEGIVGYAGSEVGTGLIEKLNIGPLQRLLQSPSTLSRRLGGMLADSSMLQRKGLRGIAAARSVEAVHRDDMAMVDRAVDRQSKLFREHKSGPVRVSAKEFNERIASAMRNGDIDPQIPQVTAAAQEWRRTMQPILDRALETGELVDDWTKMVDRGFADYNRVFDADVERYGAGIDTLTETYFRAFQKGQEVQGLKLTKRMRDEVRKRVAAFIDREGFAGIDSPDYFTRLAAHVDELFEGRWVMPERGPQAPFRPWPPKGPPMPPGTAKEERAIATAERIRRRKTNMAEFADEVAETFGMLKAKHDEVLDLIGMAPDPRGAPGRGRLTRSEFEERLRRHFDRQDIDPADAMQAARVDKVGKNLRAKIAKSRGLDGWEFVRRPQRGFIYHDTAESYFPRVPDKERVAKDPMGFERGIREFLERDPDGPMLDASEAEQKAHDIARAYIDGRTPQVAIGVVGESGRSKNRVVRIPDRILEPWMNNDPATVIRSWTRDLGVRSELTKTFGDREMSGVLGELNDEYARLREAAAAQFADDEKALSREFVKLSKQRDQDLEDLRALRDRLVGHFGADSGGTKWFAELLENVRLFNMLAMLGGVVFSSVTDVAVQIQKYGILPFAQGLGRFIANMPTRHENLKDLGLGLVYAHNSRFGMLSDVDITHLSKTKQALGTFFLHGTGLTTWDTMYQRIAAYTAAATIERWTKGYARLSARRKARLSRIGIGEREAELVAGYFRSHGPDVSRWPHPAPGEPNVRHLMKLALQREVDWVSFKPMIGDQPLIMSKEVGKTLLQFKQFSINATNRLVLAGLQQADINFYMGFLVSAAIGAGVVEGKARLRGKKTELKTDVDVANFAIDSLGRAGWYGVYDPFVEFPRVAAGWTPSRYAAQNWQGALGGPSASMAGRVSNLMATALDPDRDVTWSMVGPTLPLVNMMHLRDAAERVAGYGE